MKITIYELLGLIKDGKAPKNIKYDDMIWEYDGDYYSSKNNIILEEYCNLTTSLNDEVEIIEEPQEHKIPEKIEYHQVRRNEVEVDYIEDGIVKQFCLNKKQRYFADKINEIIDYLEEIE